MLTAQQALNVAHGWSIPTEIAQTFASIKDGWQITPVTYLNEATARQRLQALEPDMSRPTQEASLMVQGEQIFAIPGEFGYTINLDATMADLAADPGAVLAAGVLWVTPQVVLPGVMDATPALEAAQRLLDTPVVLQAYDAIYDENLTWTAPRQTVASWLAVEAGESGPQVGLDAAQIANYLGALSAELGPGRYLWRRPFSGA